MSKTRETKRLNLSGPVRITLPAKVAYNIDTLQSSIANIMERLGCPNCFSGAECTFRLEREFVMNPDAKVAELNQPVSTLFSTDPDVDPVTPVNAVLAGEVSHNIQSVQEAVSRIVDRLGHTMCFSGFDIAFRSELDLITVDKEMDVRSFGRF